MLKCFNQPTARFPFRCILATDMAKHNEIVNSFKALIPHFDFNDKEHRAVVSTLRVCHILMRTGELLL